MHEHYSAITKTGLSLRLYPLSIRELMYIPKVPCDIYSYNNQSFRIIINKHTPIDNSFIRDLARQGDTDFYIYKEDHLLIKQEIQKNLTLVTRSLSVGNAVENAKQQMNLLTINMSYLYDKPTDDETLALQYQCSKNLAYFLIKHINYHEVLYKEFLKQKHHFIYAQPLIASLFTLGLLKYSKKYNDQEIEALFISSYFKDIGMSSIPESKYNDENLSLEDKALINSHAEHSVQILKGRINLTPNHYLIIENHHSFSLLKSNYDIMPKRKDDLSTVFGFETVIVSIMDIIAAAIHGRPFRDPIKVFDALSLIKNLIVDKYPQEFKLIVGYFKKFFFDK
jgi:hypothetical protein